MRKKILKSILSTAVCIALTAAMSMTSFAWGSGVISLVVGDPDKDGFMMAPQYDENTGLIFSYLSPDNRTFCFKSEDSTVPPDGKHVYTGLLGYSEAIGAYATRMIGGYHPFEYDKEYTMFDSFDDEWEDALKNAEDTLLFVYCYDDDDDSYYSFYFRLSNDPALTEAVDPDESYYGWIWDGTGYKYDYGSGLGSPVNQWQYIKNKWYYFDEDGYMVTGWHIFNGQWYNFDDDGALISDTAPAGQPFS